MLFVDFANSLGFDGSWGRMGWHRITRAPFPALMRRHLDKRLLAETVERIEGLSEATIRGIIHRIPRSHLGRPQKAVIAAGLLGRRRLVAGALRAELA
jgi:hypothetical protein